MVKLSLVAMSSVALACAAFSGEAAAQPSDCINVEGLSSTFVWCENSLTRMSEAERLSRVLAEPLQFPSEESETTDEAGVRAFEVPASPADHYFSWHNVDGVDWMTPVRDQAQCGSCFVFGSLGALESQIKVNTGNPYVDVDLSEQSIISCGLIGSCGNGGFAEEVALQLRSIGVTDESCYPYLAEEGQCSERCRDWVNRSVRIASAHMSARPWSESQLKSRIVQSPVIVNMQVYDDFYGYKSGVYSRSSSAEPSGWHMVALVGWDDIDFSWIVRNSWGSNWGDRGYFKISRSADCPLVFYGGVCFASHATTLDFEYDETPGVPCLESTTVHLTADGDAPVFHDALLSNCGRTGPIDVAVGVLPGWLDADVGNPALGVGVSTVVRLTASPQKSGPGTHKASVVFRGGHGLSTLRVVFDVPADVLIVPDAGIDDDASGGGIAPTADSGSGEIDDTVGAAASPATQDQDGGCGCAVPGLRGCSGALGVLCVFGMLGLCRRRSWVKPFASSRYVRAITAGVRPVM